MKAALLDNNRVVNVVELPENFDGDEWAGLPIYVLSEEEVLGPNWILEEGTFIPPDPLPEPEPDPRDVKIAELEDQVATHNAAIQQLILDLLFME